MITFEFTSNERFFILIFSFRRKPSYSEKKPRQNLPAYDGPSYAFNEFSQEAPSFDFNESRDNGPTFEFNDPGTGSVDYGSPSFEFEKPKRESGTNSFGYEKPRQDNSPNDFNSFERPRRNNLPPHDFNDFEKPRREGLPHDFDSFEKPRRDGPPEFDKSNMPPENPQPFGFDRQRQNGPSYNYNKPRQRRPQPFGFDKPNPNPPLYGFDEPGFELNDSPHNGPPFEFNKPRQGGPKSFNKPIRSRKRKRRPFENSFRGPNSEPIKRYEESPIDNRPYDSSGLPGPQGYGQDDEQGILLMEDQRHQTPAFRKKFKSRNPSSSGPYSPYSPPRTPIPVYNPPEYHEAHHFDDEVEDRFHDDRRKNLQHFFKERPAPAALQITNNLSGERFHFSQDEVSDRIIPSPADNLREALEIDIDDDEPDFESFGEKETRKEDPFEFPSNYFARLVLSSKW